jgi:hypothetical protein
VFFVANEFAPSLEPLILRIYTAMNPDPFLSALSAVKNPLLPAQN